VRYLALFLLLTAPVWGCTCISLDFCRHGQSTHLFIGEVVSGGLVTPQREPVPRLQEVSKDRVGRFAFRNVPTRGYLLASGIENCRVEASRELTW
jgi:hypothetical protein